MQNARRAARYFRRHHHAPVRGRQGSRRGLARRRGADDGARGRVRHHAARGRGGERQDGAGHR